MSYWISLFVFHYNATRELYFWFPKNAQSTAKRTLSLFFFFFFFRRDYQRREAHTLFLLRRDYDRAAPEIVILEVVLRGEKREIQLTADPKIFHSRDLHYRAVSPGVS